MTPNTDCDPHLPVVVFDVRLPCGQAKCERDYLGENHFYINKQELTTREYLRRVGQHP